MSFYFKNRLIKQKEDDIWASTSNTSKILNLTPDSLYALRKHKQIIENVDFKKINKNRQRSPLKYNLQKLCLKVYGLSLETFTDPDFDYKKWLSTQYERRNKWI